METVNDIFDKWGVDLVNDLKLSLKNKGVVYPKGESRLAGRIRYHIINKDGILTFQLIMPDYAEYLDSGRGSSKSGSEPGKVKPAIQNWLARKGLVEPFRIKLESARKNNSKRIPFEKAASQLAFVVSRSLHKKGFKGNHFYTDVINDGRKNELIQMLTEFYKKEITLDFG